MEVVRQKNVASYVVFPIVDADGDLVTAAAGLDSEIDAFADGAAPDGFADCTNEATEIGTTGLYYLSLTNTELNVDYAVVQVKTSTSGAKTQVILIRTMVGDPLNVAVTDDGTAINVASGAVDAAVTSMGANVVTAAAIADGAIDAATFAAGAIDATAIAANAIGASELAADAVDEIWDEAIAELAQAAPSATPAMRAALSLLYMVARNAVTVTATEKTFSNDAGTVVFKKALSDDGTTYTEGEMVTGP